MPITTLLLLASAFTYTFGRPISDAQPFAESYRLRDSSNTSHDQLLVDLGYQVYRGVANSTTNINTWKGIRFAAPPIGPNRWQAPQVPAVNRSEVVIADTYASQCPQSGNSEGNPVAIGISGDEDCLFLNVFAPAGTTTKALPVLVWIHGGGYGLLNGQLDFAPIVNANNNSFIGVSIQYRLGAFGFLSSQEVYNHGVVNAGIHDQYFALQWVQQYIAQFGGDPSQVTISGESAGGGSVMLLDVAYGGTLGTKLFQNSIAASPYLPSQYMYNDLNPTSNYNAFVERANCSAQAGGVFACLVAAPTEVLQNASSYVSSSVVFGTWAFAPVTDGSLIQDLPSRQLAAGKVNGRFMLTGNNAIEGWFFVPKNITVETDIAAWLAVTYPTLTAANIDSILAQYPIQDTSITATSPRFATNGLTNPSANEVSPEGTAQLQRAFNIYSEITFVCPSYWLAEAYTMAGNGNNASGAGYKYQYSVIPSTHGQDVAGYFNPPMTPHSPDFSLAFKTIWGNFITTSNPSTSNLIANGQSTSNNTDNPASSWPIFDTQTWSMINLNETFSSTVTVNDQVYPGDNIMNDITLVDAYAWEAGRGQRCEFWKVMGAQTATR